MSGAPEVGPHSSDGFDGFHGEDALGRQVHLPRRPERIVSLVPSITDLLHALDLGIRVVGITRFCERPEDWRETKAIVGGTKNVKHDALTKLNPDLVLANLEENEKDDVARLDVPVYVTDVRTVPDACEMIRTVGQLTGTGAAARTMAQTITDRFDRLTITPRTRAVYLIWREPYMSVGHDTFIHDVMTRGGFQNVFSEETRYPEVTLTQIADAEPDVVLCSSEPFPFHQKDTFTADLREALPDTPIEIVDGQLFSWYGPRLLDTPSYLVDLSEEWSTGRSAA
ncbi:helical backbone metal receptor [Longibacter sp.]|uniref:helical backbone metal receptor n=1 Tax=Longibacter sp. TaxID=2045415 RepID=UPI003EC0CB7A